MDDRGPEHYTNCREHEGPWCLTLLTDPVKALSERDHWPKHLCMTVAKRLTERAWYNHRAVTGRDTRTTIELYLTVVPGQEELLLAFDSPDHADGAHIACGLTLPLPDAQIVFWGLARLDEDGLATVAGCTFDLSGPKPDEKEVLRLVKSCRRWWARFEGKRLTGSINAGRKKGSRNHTASYRSKVAESFMRRVNSGVPRRVAADFEGHDPGTLEEWAREFGINPN